MPHVIVIGAGPVGATFALLAKRLGIEVTLLEAREGVSRETRSLALSHGSREILDSCGVWTDALKATPIHSIHTSQRGGFGRMKLTRDDASVPALGYVLSYASLQEGLDAQLATASFAVLRGALVSAIDNDIDDVAVHFAFQGEQRGLRADAVVLADGGANLSKIPSLSVIEKDYQQSALLAHVVTDQAHCGAAYERFTPEGPAALLPHGGATEYSLVWVSEHARIDALMALDDAAFLSAFQVHFGRRAGRFLSIGPRRRFPLKLRTVSSRVANRVAIIGNAAQALHPVAGQGFNLGLRDADTLSRSLAGAPSATAVQQALADYASTRERDVDRSVGFTDFLVNAFSNGHLAARVPRGLALAAMDVMPLARRSLARRMLFGAPQ